MIRQSDDIDAWLAERSHWQFAGVDEAGRGPLAGPVVAAAVVLPRKHDINGLDDSKKLTEAQRESLEEKIKQRALSWALGRAEVDEIDEINILQASLLAMRRALQAIRVDFDMALVDGNKSPSSSIPNECVIKGDQRVEVIAAASILAKQARDREMLDWDQQYPQYGFARHKGYPTKQHLQALDEFGVCSIHRKTYGPVKTRLPGN